MVDFVISEKKIGNTTSTPQGSETKKKKTPIFTDDLEILFKTFSGCMFTYVL